MQLLKLNEDIEEEEDQIDGIFQMPMDNFGGHIDVSDLNINLHHNLEQERKQREDSRQKLSS